MPEPRTRKVVLHKLCKVPGASLPNGRNIYQPLSKRDGQRDCILRIGHPNSIDKVERLDLFTGIGHEHQRTGCPKLRRPDGRFVPISAAQGSGILKADNSHWQFQFRAYIRLMWKLALLVVAVVIVGAGVATIWSYRQASNDAERAMSGIAGRTKPPSEVFDPSLVAGLPEIAQRYFTHAIAPGTPLHTTVRLEMKGTFLLGDKASFQTYAMTARQILAPPSEFVWIPSMQSGVMSISGSDALVQGAGWTRFWINGLVPVVNLQATTDLNRSALTRAAMEAMWAPASLLPGNGVAWEQTGPSTARLSFTTGIEPVDMTLAPDGRVVKVVTMRWSDANPEKTFRLQPFGGTMEAEATFAGFTIPSLVKVGNHFGTDDYLPFFQAQIMAAEFL